MALTPMDLLLKQHQETYEKIPAEVRRALTPVETLARCIEAERLIETGRPFQGEMGRYYSRKAAAVLEAEPADRVAAQVRESLALAEATGDPVLRSAYRAKAAQARDANPQPPNRITEAAAAAASHAVEAARETSLRKQVEDAVRHAMTSQLAAGQGRTGTDAPSDPSMLYKLRRHRV